MAPLVTTQSTTQPSEMTTQIDINTSSTQPATTAAASTTTTPTRGRTRTANPIGLSRQSSSFYERENNNNNNDQQRSRSASITRRSSETTPRSNSLTRQSSLDLSSHGIMRRSNSFSDVRPLTLQRTNSFTSVNSNNTSSSVVEEPMWFSHAFGSGVKVDLVDHPELASVCSEKVSVDNVIVGDGGESVNNDNVIGIKDVTGDDNSLENGCSDREDNNDEGEDSQHNSSPKLLERSDTGVISVDSSVTSGYSGPSFASSNENDDLEDIDTSARGVKDEIQEEEQSVARSVREMRQCISDIDNSNNVEEIETPSSTPLRLTVEERKQQLFDNEMNDTGDSNTTKKKRIGTLSDLNRLPSADNLKKNVVGGPQRQQSQGTLDSSFDIDQGMSIQSELLGAGEDRPSALRPVHNNKQLNENDVSSITMDHLPTNQTVTSISATATPTPFHGSIKQWEEHNNTEQSWLTTQQQQSSPKAKRSFVTNVKAHTIDKISKTRKKNNKSKSPAAPEEDDSSTDSPQQRPQGRRRGRSLGLKKRVSRKGIQQNNNPHPYNKKDSDESHDDIKVRERSRSIVRDVLSFMESIDNDDEGGDSRQREGRSLPPPRSRRSMKESQVTVTSGDTTVGRGQQGLHTRRPSSDSTNSSGSSREEEASIQSNLQQQITDLTNERNALRTNSERLMEVLTQQKSELETELTNERKGFANVSHSQKKEIEELKTKAKRMERKCKKMEGQLKVSKGIERKDTQHNESIFSLDMSTSELGNEALHLASTFGVDMSSTLSSSDEITQAEKNLHFALLKMSEMEARHAEQIQLLTFDNTSMKDQADEMKTKYDELNKEHQDLLNVRDDETATVSALENKLEGYRIVIESMEKAEGNSDRDTSTKNVNDELVEKIGDLADTNGQLLAKCQKLERELQSQSSSLSSSPLHHLTKELELCQMKNVEASTTIETLQVDNRNLRSSLANQGLDSSLKSEDSSVTAEAVKQVLEDEEDNSKKPTEIEHEEALAMIQTMQLENDTLHASMEEAVELATGMNVKMSNFVKTHEASSKEYEEKIKALKSELSESQVSKDELSTKIETLQKEIEKLSSELEEANSMVVSSVRDEIAQEQLSKETWDKEKQELSVAIDELKKENKTLHESMKEMNSLVTTAEECVDKLTEENATLKQTQEFYEQQYEELNTEKESNTYLRDEIKGISMEREEAYETCKVLQQEINVLRQSVKESKGRVPVEHLHSDGSILTTDDYRFAELTKANESLTNELEKKNAALQAVQSALESLKEEQSTIKETISELRTENAKLLTAQQVLALPPPPRSSKKPKSSSSTGDSSDSSIILKLESQVKKIHKENKGLREANNTLSAKLFDEMERTDALRVANEGLAARICKLVAFIQQTPNSSANAGIGGGGGGGGNASASSGGSSGKSSSRRGSKSPARQKKKK